MGSGIVSPGHLVIVVLIALIVFGPKRLPEVGRALGSGMRGFKQSIAGEDEEESGQHGERTAGESPSLAPGSAAQAAAPPAAEPAAVASETPSQSSSPQA